ncbi:hypothetical protein ACFYV7_11535 [Nocardia suismassiliense]|uniref:Uncharacterized protein n=1 Tax=Nocardia suismassiliense TaxID=2077092 RepID=A0ABW6QR50_9NOCA
MSSPDEARFDDPARQLGADLQAFGAAYRDAEVSSRPVLSVSHAGWHPGARIGARTAGGSLLAYNDSGHAAELLFDESPQPIGNIWGDGFRGNFIRRPFSIVNVRQHGVSGEIAEGAEKLELISQDGTVFDADIVARTFGVTIDLDLPYERQMGELREAGASTDEILDVLFGSDTGEQQRAATRHLTVRVYDGNDTVLHEGPVFEDD